jgi:hypothetical protein
MPTCRIVDLDEEVPPPNVLPTRALPNDCRMMKFVFTAVATRALASTAAYSSTAAGRSQSDGPNSTVSAAAPSTIRCWSSPVPGAFPSNLRRVHEHGRLQSVERRRLGPTGKIG